MIVNCKMNFKECKIDWRCYNKKIKKHSKAFRNLKCKLQKNIIKKQKFRKDLMKFNLLILENKC